MRIGLKAGARRYSFATSATILAVMFVVLRTDAQNSKTPPRKVIPQVPVVSSHDCGNGVRLQLVGAATQGGLLELTVKSADPVDDLKADWAGTEVRFWSDPQRVQHALLGVDLEKIPGKYDLKLSGQFGSSHEPLRCSSEVDVTTGHFAVESLKVAPGFVELSPDDRARADKEGQHIHEIWARITPERLWTGRFRMPLDGNRTGHNFGKRRVLNGKPQSPHTGLDIGAPAGTPIHASQCGHVVLAENLFFSGNTVIIDHGLGVYTFYGHMKSMKVAEGDDVNVGSVIGEVGATGRATGPHLHWTLIVDGARVNPLGIVRLGPK